MVNCIKCAWEASNKKAFDAARATGIPLVLKEGNNLIELHLDGTKKIIKKLEKHGLTLPKQFTIDEKLKPFSGNIGFNDLTAGDGIKSSVQPKKAILPTSTKQTVERIVGVLNSRRLNLSSEKELQKEIELLFWKNNIPFTREYRLDNKNIPDFFVDGVAIEVKIKGQKAKTIYKQCERYCQFEETKALLLITSRSMGFPEQINGKDCYYYSLSKNWL
jgi:hypothetical protein